MEFINHLASHLGRLGASLLDQACTRARERTIPEIVFLLQQLHEERSRYIDFQLKQAGGSEKLFEPATKELLHDYSGGIPRQINNLATACLLQASAENAPRVNEAIVRKTFSEFQLP